jgi:hypothetical protein
MLWTEAVSVVCKRYFTVMDGTAQAANSNTINDHNPDFSTITQEPQTLLTVMVQLRLPIYMEVKVTRMQCSHEMVFLSTCMGHLK